MDWTRLYNASQRHQLAWLGGESIDPESKLMHMAHAAWGLLAIITFELYKLGTDDRFRYPALAVD